MKYLFFDIEGACPKLCTVATFGYVLSDEKFNIKEKTDILMNPDSKYDWYVVKNLLSYSKKTLAEKPKFDAHYGKIKALLEDKDTLVCGYSIVNDLKYLNSECKRYSLPSFDFSFMDVQMLADSFFESKNQIGIERAYSMLGIEDTMILHRSDEDARAAMNVAKAICKIENSNLFDLAKKHGATGHNKDFIYEFDAKPPKKVKNTNL